MLKNKNIFKIVKGERGKGESLIFIPIRPNADRSHSRRASERESSFNLAEIVETYKYGELVRMDYGYLLFRGSEFHACFTLWEITKILPISDMPRMMKRVSSSEWS